MDTLDTIELYVPTQSAGERLDRFVAQTVADLSRSLVQQLIGSGHVTVDGRWCARA